MDKLFNSKLYTYHRFKLIMAIDLVIVFFGTILGIFLERNVYIPEMISLYGVDILELSLISLIIYGTMFKIFRINKSLWSYLGVNEIVYICLSCLLSSIMCDVVYIIIMQNNFSQLRFFFFAPMLIVSGLMFVRLFYKSIRETFLRNSKEKRYKRALIIGAGDAGYILLKELTKNNRFNANVIGLIDDNRVNSTIHGIDVLGTTYDLYKIIPKYDIEMVFLAIPSLNKENKNRILNILKNLSVQVKVMKSGLSLIEGESITNHIQDISISDLLGRGEAKLSQGEIKSYLKEKVVLITGAGGSIGSQLAREVFKFKPANLILVDINENSLYMLERELDFKKMESDNYDSVEYISEIVSIRDREGLEEVFSKYKPDVVYHAAAHKHVPLMERRPQEAIKNNVFGTKNVMDISIKYAVDRFIMISTDKAVNPTNAMGASKRLTEIILQSKGDKYNTKFAAVRFGNVLGSNGSVIPIFKEQIKKGGPVTLTHKNIIRYFMTIPEASQLVLQAGYYASSGEIFLLDMGEPVKILDLAKNLIKLSGLEPYKDIAIKEIGLRPGEKMYEELSLDYENSEKTDNKMIYKNKKLDIDENKLNEELLILYTKLETHSNEDIRKALFDLINRYNG